LHRLLWEALPSLNRFLCAGIGAGGRHRAYTATDGAAPAADPFVHGAAQAAGCMAASADARLGGPDQHFSARSGGAGCLMGAERIAGAKCTERGPVE